MTGGGWIDSPPGAYAGEPALSGRASFGFVARYKQGTGLPAGNVEFHLSVAKLHFHATTYESLEIVGAKAMFQGVGTIKAAGEQGSSQAGFLVSVVDGQLDGPSLDRFRIKIWHLAGEGTVIYDSQVGNADSADPTAALGGGSIVIHPEK